ncbi:unnamed protein product [Peniophora sp. CBMAI 1063]|nr:unnamed protein product [Peniophora sp. CBMAI 1063]
MVGPIPRSYTIPASGTGLASATYTLASRAPAPGVVYARTVAELDAALQGFNGPYGIDCEWRCMPQDSRVALIQLSNGKKVVLAQVSAMSAFPARLKAILEDPNVVKVGHAIEGDAARLKADYNITIQNLYNIAPIGLRVDAPFRREYTSRNFIALTTVVGHFLKRTLPKGPVRQSNWERVPLTAAQREYAAGDAHCVYEIYALLRSRAAQAGIRLQECGKLRIQDYRKGSFEDKFPLEHQPRLEGLEPNEFYAYTMWDQGYSIADIRTTLVKYGLVSLQTEETAMISLIVTTLTKKPELSFDPVMLRALIEGNPAASHEHATFLAERCPVAATPAAEEQPAASTSARSTAASQSAAGKEPSTRKRGRQERETTPEEEETPRRSAKRGAPSPSPSPGRRAVKRARTIT